MHIEHDEPFDESALLAVLYSRHAPLVLRVAYRLTGSVADAQDVTHDVFVMLPGALRQYEERGRLEAWLSQMTTRVALSRLRKQRRRGEEDFADNDAATPASNASDIAARVDLQRAISALPESLRAVFVLKEMEGCTHSEIADALGITTRASEVRLSRAFKALRGVLTR